MSTNEERSISLWADIDVASEASPPNRDARFDVIVVGSGISGLSIAYELATRGRSVAVLDRGPISKGMTARTTAHLLSICDDYFSELRTLRGERLARLYYQSQSMAIDRIEAIQELESIACDFRRLDGFLFAASDRDEADIDRELASGQRLGVTLERVVGMPFAGHASTPAVRYARQGTFHPMKYMRGLAAAIVGRGGVLHANTIVEKVEESAGGTRVTTGAGAVLSADYAVVATNSPINDRVVLHTKQAPYRTYAMAFEIERGLVPDGLYWDTEDPYHYLRLQPGPAQTDVLIVGGEDHKTGEADNAEDRFAAIEAWTRRMVPGVGTVTHRWSGQIMETMDYAGFIGRNPGGRRIFVATGDSGQGMTHGALAGLLIADLIVKDDSPWEELYDPSRKTIEAFGNFLKENSTAIKNFAEYIAPGEVASVDLLEPGEGAIVREGFSKIAAYRDDDGILYRRSAACTHIGCHVHWNSFERCWDCPCHGSHFAIDGTALNGPAILPLASMDE